jgi:hypothetical protein
LTATPTETPTNTPTPTPTTPEILGSFYFPTDNSYITLSPGIVVGGTYQTPFTVEGWFYSGDNPGTNSGPVILSTTTGSGTLGYARALTINVSTPTQIVVDSNGAAATTFNLSQTLISDTWYYLAVSRDTSGLIQIWLGEEGDVNAVASTSGAFDCSVNTAVWALDGLSDSIGVFVPANRFSTLDYISNLRVSNDGLYATNSSTIPMPTSPFDEISGTVFLQSPTSITDITGNQTLTVVGSTSQSSFGPTII